MSDTLILCLLAVFTLHFGIFLYLSLKNRKTQHMFVTLTFALLVLSFSCRLVLPEVEWFGHKLHTALRISAWMSTAVVLFLSVRGRMSARRNAAEQPAILCDADQQNP